MPAPVADCAWLHPLPVRGHRHRRPVRHPREHHHHGAHPGPASRHVRVGTGRGGVQPRAHGARTTGRGATRGLQAVRDRAACLHRAAVRPPGGGPGARDAAPTLRPRRPSRLPAGHEDHAHGQARRLPDPRTAAARRARQAWRARRAGRDPQHAVAHRTGRGAGPAGAPARDQADGAVRLQPRHRRVPRHPARRGRRRTRLRRDRGGTRRPRRRPPGRRRAGHRLRVVQRDAPRQRRRVLPLDRGCARGRGAGGVLQRVRVRQHGVGLDLPGRA